MFGTEGTVHVKALKREHHWCIRGTGWSKEGCSGSRGEAELAGVVLLIRVQPEPPGNYIKL